MPKHSTYPPLYDEVLQIDISKLKKWGFLEPGQKVSGTLNWSCRGNPTGSISITTDSIAKQPYIELNYNYKDEPRNYKINLVSVPSNLNKGKIWYFLCPHTKKRCRKLYSIGGYFLHRQAFNGCMYECQTESKYYRQLGKAFFCTDKYFEQLHAKHFKRYYAGKPTKRYLRLMEKIHKAENESVPITEMKRLLWK